MWLVRLNLDNTEARVGPLDKLINKRRYKMYRVSDKKTKAHTWTEIILFWIAIIFLFLIATFGR